MAALTPQLTTALANVAAWHSADPEEDDEGGGGGGGGGGRKRRGNEGKEKERGKEKDSDRKRRKGEKKARARFAPAARGCPLYSATRRSFGRPLLLSNCNFFFVGGQAEAARRAGGIRRRGKSCLAVPRPALPPHNIVLPPHPIPLPL